MRSASFDREYSMMGPWIRDGKYVNLLTSKCEFSKPKSGSMIGAPGFLLLRQSYATDCRCHLARTDRRDAVRFGHSAYLFHQVLRASCAYAARPRRLVASARRSGNRLRILVFCPADLHGCGPGLGRGVRLSRQESFR